MVELRNLDWIEKVMVEQRYCPTDFVSNILY